MKCCRVIADIEVNSCAFVDVLVLDIEERATQAGRPYCIIEVRDRDRKHHLKYWNGGKDVVENCLFAIGDVASISVDVKLYNGDRDYTLKEAVRSKADIKEFLPCAPHPVEDMWNELLDYTSKIENTVLSHVVGTLLGENKTAFCNVAAGSSMHHAVIGGLLWHTLSVTRIAYANAGLIPCNKDLVLAGAILHDIGKVLEMETDKLGKTTYTMDGNLLGHSVLGINMLNVLNMSDKPEVKALCHIIGSHHGSREFGAVCEPSTVEALIVSCADGLDASVFKMVDADKSLADGEFSKQLRGGGRYIKVIPDSIA